MKRTELYQKVKEMNLQEKIQKKFNKNFTQVSSAELEKFINTEKNRINKKKESSASINPKKEPVKEVNLINSPFEALVKILAKKHLLSEKERNELLNMLKINVF